jgi:tetratricopeptide (TPR) repeat protein
LGAYETSAEEYRAAGRLDDARETLVETLALHADLGNRRDLERTASELLAEVEGRREPPLEADVWFELGAGRMAFADHEGALDAFARAAAGYRSVGRRLEEAQSTYSMATPHVALFRFVEAHADLIAALRIAVDLSDTASVVAIRTQLVQVRDLIRMRSAEPPPIPEELRSLVEP